MDASGGPLPTARWHATTARAAVRTGRDADPRQTYDSWLRFGILRRPDPDTLTRGWTTADRAALSDHDCVFSADLRAAWRRLNQAAEVTE